MVRYFSTWSALIPDDTWSCRQDLLLAGSSSVYDVGTAAFRVDAGIMYSVVTTREI